ncbi:hypothetical protein LRAMOSA04668 [Lichtheimia ramosa]|uniref:Amidohydrolase-related domain-containing protein n=1 Tax=Lichtheimia ramosa TaxID=688394 RepID=A0A077WZ70_9FUNG|nr:hypothetical protein LRAMOSA04668 [Lichtheimia ramosa]
MARYSNSLGKTNDNLPLLRPTQKPKTRRIHLGIVAACVAVFGASSVFYLSGYLPTHTTFATRDIRDQGLWDNGNQQAQVVSPGISWSSFQYGLEQCQSIQQHDSDKQQQQQQQSRRNPRSAYHGKLLIKNGHMWLGDRYLDGDLLVEDGIIRDIQPSGVIDVNSSDQVIDAGGRVVTPGIVDMHSHMLAASFPGLDALADENEMTDPTTPYVRIIDSINPGDPALKVVASGGITTSLILPGSGNLMGGEAAVVKLRPVPTLSGQDMLITANITEQDHEKIWRYMKMACGENPTGYYGGELNRMGESWLFRQRFEEAREILRAQDDWCDAAMRINNTMPADVTEDNMIRLSERFPESLKHESLIALLRHQVKLNVHCYLPQDLEAMVDHSLEFDFEIAAFHHALSAWQVPDIIKRAKTNITIATFADMWGYKQEAMDQNVNAPNILSQAGIPVAFKSDHPVMNARDLVHEAQKAYHYGFDEHKALQALTSVPAAALAVDHRVGSLQVGKDADIVIWHRHPLRLGARPEHVIIDGQTLDFKASWGKHVEDEDQSDDEPVEVSDDNDDNEFLRSWLPPRPTGAMTLDKPDTMDQACTPETDSFVLRNISRLYMGPGQVYNGSAYLVVEDGQVVCAGPECSHDQVQWPTSSPVFDMDGAIVIPGIVSSGAPLGLGEIGSEQSTLDGYAENDISSPDLAQSVVRAVDGLKLDGLRLKKAFKAGVTTSVSQPIAYGELLAGVSVAFRTGVANTLLDSSATIINQEAALHFTINHGSKLTVSQQIAGIRELLLRHADKNDDSDVFARAAQGKLPVVVETNDKDEIASIIQMKQQVLSKVQFIILGGAESHLVAKHLARNHIPVILMPARCYASTWQSRLCLYGPPLTPETVLDVLIQHGVNVGLASTEFENGDSRNLIWEAGWNLAHNTKLSEEDAIGLVTWNVAEIFGLDRPENPSPVGVLRQGRKADFVAYNGNPFEFGTSVLMVYGGGHSGPLCYPKQT